ncbi:SIGLEC family-like protein 1 [Thomomys bottae]
MNAEGWPGQGSELRTVTDPTESADGTQWKRGAPARLLSYTCSLERALKCSCSFHGVPTPSVQWWIGDIPVGSGRTGKPLQVTSSKLGPWTNSTIYLRGDPDLIMRLQCERKNQLGTHASRIILLADKTPLSKVFRRGLTHGIVYGAIASALLLFLLVLLAKKIVMWCQELQDAKAIEDQSLNSLGAGEAPVPEGV